MSALSGVSLEDFDKTHTGYTNRYLEVRNDLRTPYNYKGDPLYEEMGKPPPNYVHTVTKDYEKTPLSMIFFSQRNVDYLQEKMKEIVKKESGHTIGNQSEPELLTIMKRYYLEDGKNLPYELEKQVAELNYRVLKYAVFDQILPKVKGYGTFLYDNVRTNVVLPRERYVSMSGARVNRGFADLI